MVDDQPRALNIDLIRQRGFVPTLADSAEAAETEVV
jgi:hypothetical protein